MKVVILAGGLGTRLTEETETRPKPMVEIGGRPILWHIMKLYAHFGFREFVVALGYKGDVIKRYFLDYAKLQSNFTVNLASGDVMRRGGQPEDWTVHLVDTGGATNTGGRLKRLAPILGRETFMATYGDGVSNVDINALVAVPPPAWQAGNDHRRAAPGPLWRPGLRWRPDRRVHREAPDRRGLDQWRVLRARARCPRVYRRRPDELGARADGAAGYAGSTDGLPARRFLAMHGHASRPQAPGEPLGQW